MTPPPRNPDDADADGLDPATEKDIEANPQPQPDGPQADVPEENRPEVKDTEVQPT